MSDEKQKPEQYVHDRRERKLDQDAIKVNQRVHWYQIWRPSQKPPPTRNSFQDAPIIPLATASWLSILTFGWVTPLMDLGYRRTLQATDLYAMDESRSAGFLANKLEEAWARRVEKAKAYNIRLENGEIKPALPTRFKWWIIRAVGHKLKREEQEARWRQDSQRKASLAWALNDVLGHRFWIAGAYKVFGDFSQMMIPLVVRAIITFGQKQFAASHPIPGQPPSSSPAIVGGVFMAVGLLILTVFQNIGQQHFFWRSMSTGVLARAALISATYKRGVYLTPEARKEFDNSKLLHFVSGDISRIDAAAQWFHAAWTAPIQVITCLVILLIQLGPTALIGFILFVLLIPMQEFLLKLQFRIRRTASNWSDKRMAILSECLGGIKVVKWFCYENRFLKRIAELRAHELRGVWRIEILSSLNQAVGWSIPVIGAVLSFIAYLLTAHDFNVAIIFSSLSLFNLLRQPLLFLPRAMSGIADARSALERLTPLFEAPQVQDVELNMDPSNKWAVDIRNASFEWTESMEERIARQKVHAKGKKGSRTQKAEQDLSEKNTKPVVASKPFALHEISMQIPRGQAVAIVGPVASGKSSLLQGLVGEMRQSKGSIQFGGKVAYCPQVAWIQNTSLRENILFGSKFEEGRYWAAVDNACLLPDLDVLPDGDMTEIGERGINLSGGQKQRVNIARALYYDADIIIMDDPLSAVDAHVGKALFHNAILGNLRARGKTVILVTHALHFVSEVDYIYTLKNGRIAEHGTYNDLMAHRKEFYLLLSEHVGAASKEDKEESDETEGNKEEEKTAKKTSEKAGGKAKGPGEALISQERRSIGGVSWHVYWSYLGSGKGGVLAPFIVISAIAMQASMILNSYVLVWWQANSFNLSEQIYALIYAALGIGNAIFTFLLGVTIAAMARENSYSLHEKAVRRVFHAPTSFFDTTPLGRLVGVFGKDFDSIDNQLTMSFRMFILTLTNGIGAIVIVTILEQYFLIAVFVILVVYRFIGHFYSSSSREIKRLDSMLRSWLYAHFQESLTGIPTIKAYGALPMFISDNEYYIDLEDRALYLTVTNQRWLGWRLGLLGSMLTFVVALFAVLGTQGISPAQIGLVLTYTTQLSQLMIVITRSSTEVENYMNAVERVVEYSDEHNLQQEAPQEIPSEKPQKDWPKDGFISWENVSMAYRPGLPNVLKDVTMEIEGGEKIGVVGRTGAGKSSLIVALFRLAELNGGRILIDDVDISKIGLKDLRSCLSIIPQDPLLFSGTIRSNLDPFSLYDDAHLWDALRRACLVEPQAVKRSNSVQTIDLETSATPTSRFNLDSIVEAEGLNMSVGQRSLLSLARALVKDAQIVILDEATASVDLETDAKIQKTIQTEFQGKTMICIAHRLRTILSYDRILVMDAGKIAEFDTPLNLFDRNDGIFRGMCDRSNITRVDIEKGRRA